MHGASFISTSLPVMMPALTGNIPCCISCTAEEKMREAGLPRGKTDLILDNLIAAGKAEPMLVVMP